MPRSSLGWDLGIEQTIGENHSVSLTWFENSIEDRIRSFPTPPVNLPGDTPARGLETAVSAVLVRRDLALPGGLDLARRIAGRPARPHRHRLARLAAGRQVVLLGIGATFVDTRSLGRPAARRLPAGPAPRAATGSTEQLRLHARVENLFDSSYQLANFAGSPPIEGSGLGFFTGVTLEF